MPVCENCRREVAIDAFFCPNCGKREPARLTAPEMLSAFQMGVGLLLLLSAMFLPGIVFRMLFFKEDLENAWKHAFEGDGLTINMVSTFVVVGIFVAVVAMTNGSEKSGARSGVGGLKTNPPMFSSLSSPTKTLVSISCPYCAFVMSGDESLSGQNVACPQCRGHFEITEAVQPQESVTVQYPYCHGPINNDGSMSGQIVLCPYCHNQLKM